MKKILYPFLIFLVAIPFLSFAQDQNDYPDQYWIKLQENIEALEALQTIKTQETSASSVNVESIDPSSFPEIKVYISVYDSDGNPVPDLPADAFSIWEEHLKSGKKKVSPTIKQLKEESSNLDIVFCIDTTGSMGDEIGLIKSNLNSFVQSLVDNKVDFRIAGISFGDEVPYRGLKPFTSSIDDFVAWVSSLSAYGGNDWPENPLDCIIAAANLDYRKDAQKVIVLITDAPAHVAGDEGDSPTTSTFASAKSAIERVPGLQFYYSSPESQYALLGSPIGWPFSGTTLIDNLGTKLVVKYIASYTTPFTDKDGVKRKVSVKVGTSLDTGEYEPPLDSGTVSGTVTNIDDPPKPLEGIEIKIYGSDFSKTTKTDSDGKYRFTEVPVGTYTVETFHPDRVKGKKTVTVEKDKTAIADFKLGLVDIRDIKQQKKALIRNLKAWKAFGGLSAPFEAVETATENWVDSIPDEGASDAQEEALKREILAEKAVLESTDYVQQDVKMLASGIVGTVWSIFEALDVFKRFNSTIKSLVGKLSAYKDKWLIGSIVQKVINLIDKLNKKVIALIKSATDMVLDAIGFVMDKYGVGGTVKDIIFGLIKDIVGLLDAEGGGAATLGNLVNVVTSKISTSIVVPIYGNIVDDYLEAALNKAKSIRSADEASFRSAHNTWSTRLSDMEKNFKYKMKIAGYANDATKTLDIVGGIVKTAKAASDYFVVLVSLPVIGPIIGAIKTGIEFIDKGIAILKAGINAFGKAAPAGLHLYELPGDVNKTVGAAYNLAKIASLGTAKVSYIERFDISKNTIYIMSETKDQYIETIDQIISYIENDDLAGLGDTDLLEKLFELDDKLEDSFRNVETLLLAGSADDILSRPMFDYYFNKMMETGPQNKIDRASMFMRLFVFLLYAGINGADPADQNYLNMKEDVLNVLYAIKQETEEYTETLEEASDVKRSSPKVINIVSINSSIEKIVETPQEFSITAKLINPSTVDISDINVEIFVPDKFKDSVQFVDGNIKPVTISPNSSEEVVFNIRYAGQINGARIPFYIKLSTTDTDVALPGEKFIFVQAEGKDLNENGIPDWWEEKYAIEDVRADDDLDGLKNYLEYRFRMDPTKKDTDGDGITDLIEVATENGEFVYDVDGDNEVSIKDIAAVINSSKKNAFSTKYDFLPDGEVNELDYEILKLFWGTKRR